MNRALAIAIAALGLVLAAWLALAEDDAPARRVDAGAEAPVTSASPDAGTLVPAQVPREAVRDEPAATSTTRKAPLPDEGLSGRVLDPHGRPVAGAMVFHGPASVLSDAEGRYRFPTAPVQPTALVAVARGYRPTRVEAPRTRLGRPVDVVLSGEALSISGVVVDADGAPWPNVTVEIADGTPCDATEAPAKGPPPPPGLMAETVASGAETAIVSDADGRFRIGGLAERSYLLRFHALGLSEPQAIRAVAGTNLVAQLPITNPGPPLDGLARSRLGQGDQD